MGLRGRHRHALVGQLGGRGHHVGQRQAAQTAVHVQVAGEHAGHGDRSGTAVELLGGGGEGDRHLLEDRIGRPVGSTPSGGVDEEVEQHVGPGPAGRARRNPPPARLVKPGSHTAEANPAATTASKALPPASSMAAAASAAAVWPAATMPVRGSGGGGHGRW